MNQVLALILQYKYLILFPLAALEGPIISLVVGFLVYMHYLGAVPSYLILICGDLIPDSFYYYLGRFGNKRALMEKYQSKSKILSFNLSLLQRLWHDHGKKTMFFSKLAYGLSTPFLISAGLVNMPFKRFVSYALPVTLFQYAVIMLAGYLLGHSYLVAESYIKYAGLFAAVVLILFLSAYALFFAYARRQIIKIEEEKK